jgi:hypothetical protein
MAAPWLYPISKELVHGPHVDLESSTKNDQIEMYYFLLRDGFRGDVER